MAIVLLIPSRLLHLLLAAIILTLLGCGGNAVPGSTSSGSSSSSSASSASSSSSSTSASSSSGALSQYRIKRQVYSNLQLMAGEFVLSASLEFDFSYDLNGMLVSIEKGFGLPSPAIHPVTWVGAAAPFGHSMEIFAHYPRFYSDGLPMVVHNSMQPPASYKGNMQLKETVSYNVDPENGRIGASTKLAKGYSHVDAMVFGEQLESIEFFYDSRGRPLGTAPYGADEPEPRLIYEYAPDDFHGVDRQLFLRVRSRSDGVQFTWNAAGQLERIEAETSPGLASSVEIFYDAAGRRELEVVTLTGMGDHLFDEMSSGLSYVKNYFYDERGLLVREELFAEEIGYFKLVRESEWELAPCMAVYQYKPEAVPNYSVVEAAAAFAEPPGSGWVSYANCADLAGQQ